MWIYDHFPTSISIMHIRLIRCILTRQVVPLRFSPTMQPLSPTPCRNLGGVWALWAHLVYTAKVLEHTIQYLFGNVPMHKTPKFAKCIVYTVFIHFISNFSFSFLDHRWSSMTLSRHSMSQFVLLWPWICDLGSRSLKGFWPYYCEKPALTILVSSWCLCGVLLAVWQCVGRILLLL